MHSSLVWQEDNLEEIHNFIVIFNQKKRKLIHKLENIKHKAREEEEGTQRGDRVKVL
jgi:hypothetical protein